MLPDGSNPEPAIKFGAILAIVFNAVFEADCCCCKKKKKKLKTENIITN